MTAISIKSTLYFLNFYLNILAKNWPKIGLKIYITDPYFYVIYKNAGNIKLICVMFTKNLIPENFYCLLDFLFFSAKMSFEILHGMIGTHF